MSATALRDLEQERAALVGWLMRDAFPAWWTRGADPAGGFHEALNHDGTPVRAAHRARVQARQVYCYATAGALGWDGPWRRAVEHGLDFFFSRYRRPDGLFRTLVGADGAPADDAAMAYDQAFALLALAAASSALPHRTDLKPAALALVQALDQLAWRGGYREPQGAFPFQADLHMHLLEAATAWMRIDADPSWPALADAMAAIGLDRFIDTKTGALGEYFSPEWGPAPGDAGRIVMPGHQFEWAGLLLRWARARGRTDADATIRRLYAIGGGAGIDRTRNVAVDELLDGISVCSARARLWPQTERLKAALILAQDSLLAAGLGREALLRDAVDASRGLRTYLDMPTPGLWRDKLGPDGVFEQEPAPASSFYHIVSAIVEIERVCALGENLP